MSNRPFLASLGSVAPLIIASSLVAAPLWVTPGAAHAAEAAPTSNDMALLFSLSSLLATPGAFDNVGFGGRMRLNDATFMRVGLGLNSVSTERSDQTTGTQGSQDAPTRTESQTGVTVELGAERILAKRETLSVYGGGMVQAGWRGLSDESSDSTDTDKSATLHATVAVLLGANWFVSKRVSLGAEYRLGLTYTSDTRTQTESLNTGGGAAASVTTESTVDELRVGLGSVAFILSFWW